MNLDLREQKILESIIDFYLKTGEFVGSRTLVKEYGISASAATVRNTMSDLEDKGYLEKSHTSSGRAPTFRAYKFYIDALLQMRDLSQKELSDIKRAYKEKYEIGDGAKILSDITSHTSFSLESSTSKEKLSKIELVYINDRSFLAVVVTDSSVKTKRIILSRSISEEDIKHLSIYLNTVFRDQFLEDIQIMSDNTPLKNEAFILQNFINKIESQVSLEGGESIINYLAQRNADIDTYKIFQAKDEIKSFLEKLVDKGVDNKKINIIFGDELDGNDKLKDLSFVFSTYNTGRSKGMLGVVGPKRMEYSKVAAVVEGVTKQFKSSKK
jgi:heat-inducible transcriptional repressor